MYAFSYHSPKTVRQAATLLGKNPDAKVLAGGQTLLPTMKQRLASPSALVDLGKHRQADDVAVGLRRQRRELGR